MLQSLESDLLALRGCVLSLGTKFEDVHTHSELERLRGERLWGTVCAVIIAPEK